MTSNALGHTPVRDWLLRSQIAVIQRAQALTTHVRQRARAVAKDEAGQTPTEYLMIVGLMAAVIVLVFVTFYWGTVRDAASNWATRVRDAILGTTIQ